MAGFAALMTNAMGSRFRRLSGGSAGHEASRPRIAR